MVMLTFQSLLSISTFILLGSQCRLIESIPTSDDSNLDSKTSSYHERRLDNTNSICQLCRHSIFKVNSCRLGSSKNEDMFGTYMIPGQTEKCYDDTCCASSMSECCSPSSSDSSNEEPIAITNTNNTDSDLNIDKGSTENNDNNSFLSTETVCDVCDKSIFHVDQCRAGTAMDHNKYGTFRIMKSDQSSSECYEYTCCAWNMHDCCISSSYNGTEQENEKWGAGIIVAFILAAICMIIFVIIMIRVRPFRLYCSSDEEEENVVIVKSIEDNLKNSKLFVVEDATEIQHDNSDSSTDDNDHENNDIKENDDSRV